MLGGGGGEVGKRGWRGRRVLGGGGVHSQISKPTYPFLMSGGYNKIIPMVVHTVLWPE